jgi:hypothetical protein
MLFQRWDPFRELLWGDSALSRTWRGHVAGSPRRVSDGWGIALDVAQLTTG